MEELIKIGTDGQGSSVVSARELHSFLEVKSKFQDWIKNRIIKYGFIEGRDYVEVEGVILNSEYNLSDSDQTDTFSKNLEKVQMGRPSTDYALTLGMAKELSMVERNEKGKQARQYFIQCEETLRQVAKQQTTAPPVQLSTEQMLLQLASQQTQLLTNQQEQLDRLRADVEQIKATGHRPPQPAPARQIGRQLHLPGIPMAANGSLRPSINRHVSEYCGYHGATPQEVWKHLYRRLYDVNGILVDRLIRRDSESKLDAIERYGYLDQLYRLAVNELPYPDE